MEDRPVLVTGGTGNLGGAVVRELTGRGLPVRVLTRGHTQHPPAEAALAVGDLSDGTGLAAAVAGVRAVVHCATRPAHAKLVDVAGTGLLLAALAAHQPDAHLVYVSIVGCDRNPLSYYQAKVAAEQLVVAATTPTSVVRATQFHDLVHLFATKGNLGYFGVAVAQIRFQPSEVRYVATHLVEVALGPPLAARRDVAGPQLLSFTDAVRKVASKAGRDDLRVLRQPAWGKVLRGFARGSNLPGPGAVVGGAGFDEWLAAL